MGEGVVAQKLLAGVNGEGVQVLQKLLADVNTCGKYQCMVQVCKVCLSIVQLVIAMHVFEIWMRYYLHGCLCDILCMVDYFALSLYAAVMAIHFLWAA